MFLLKNRSKTFLLSIFFFITVVVLVTINPTPPANRPRLWLDIFDILGYLSISLFLVSLFSAMIGFIFKKWPIVKKILHSLGIVGIILIFSSLSYNLFFYPTLLGKKQETVCIFCSFTKGDFVWYVDVDKEQVTGEIVAMGGDLIVIKNNQIFVNNKTVSSLMTFFSNSDEKTISLSDKEYYILPGDLPRSLNGDKAKDYVIHQKYISGKVINHQQTTILDKLTPDSTQGWPDPLTNPTAIFLREALNNYANGVKDTRITTQALNSEKREDGVYGLSSFDKGMLKDRFFVLHESDGLGEGQIISFILINHSDRIYQAWVYQLADKTFELREFYVQDNLDGDSIKQFIQYFQPLITNEKYTI